MHNPKLSPILLCLTIALSIAAAAMQYTNYLHPATFNPATTVVYWAGVALTASLAVIFSPRA